VKTDLTTLLALCEKADNDIRSCLNTLQVISPCESFSLSDCFVIVTCEMFSLKYLGNSMIETTIDLFCFSYSMTR